MNHEHVVGTKKLKYITLLVIALALHPKHFSTRYVTVRCQKSCIRSARPDIDVTTASR